MKFSRLLKIACRACLHKLRGNHAALLEEKRLFALQLLQGHADHISFSRGDYSWTAYVSPDSVSRNLFSQGQHELDSAKALIEFLRSYGRMTPEFKVIIDVGANVGAPTLHFAALTDMHILAVEPVHETFEILQNNIKKNGFEDRVDCIPAAISTARDRLTLLWHPKPGQVEVKTESDIQGFGRVTEENRPIEVACLPLDDLIRDRAVSPHQIAFVWSDTEGYEGTVIESGKRLWAAGVPLFVELSRKIAVHSSFDAFIKIAERQFCSVILADDLLRFGSNAPRQPVSKLSDVLPQLQHHTDGLFLP